MLAESRLVLSFVSPITCLQNKENAFLTGLNPIPRLRDTHSHRRRRYARTVAHSLLGTAAYRHRARVRTSRSTHDDVQMAVSSPELSLTLSSAQPRLTLPRHLSRPKYRSIDPRAVAAVDPVLEDIPLSYIQHTLKEIGPRLLQATCNATATPPAGQLPRELQLVCNDISIEPPSHILAAYSSMAARVTLFPAHALVLATSCANLPVLSISKPEIPAAPGDSVTIPVVPLRIPSPATFPALLSYLYTNRADHLLAELLPVEEASSMDQLARKHAATFSVKELIVDARKVHGLWSNAAALGIFDDKLFQTLEMAWEVLLSALAIGTGQPVDAGIDVDAELE